MLVRPLEVGTNVASDTSLLEELSWIATIATFALVLVGGALYWLGRMRPLGCLARGEIGMQHDVSRQVFLVEGTVQSHTRNTVVVHFIALAPAPTGPARWLPFGGRLTGPTAFTKFTWSSLEDSGGALEIPGHGSRPFRAYLFAESVPYSPGTCLLMSCGARPVRYPILMSSPAE